VHQALLYATLLCATSRHDLTVYVPLIRQETVDLHSAPATGHKQKFGNNKKASRRGVVAAFALLGLHDPFWWGPQAVPKVE